MASNTEHVIHWKFFRAGGFDQIRLDTGAELAALRTLDQKLWAALSCPTKGIEMDPRTLDLIDGDHDGHIRAEEVIAAVEWACHLLKHPDLLLKRQDFLALDAVDDTRDEGKAVVAAARRILAKSGPGDAEAITLANVSGVAEVFSSNDFNGDGIIPPDVVEDESTRQVLRDIIATVGGEKDRSGLDGVSTAKVEAFFSAAETFAAWAAQPEQDDARLNPLGPDSEPAMEALDAIASKLDDWFTRSALAAYDSRAALLLTQSEQDWTALAPHLLSPTTDGLAAFPLAAVKADGEFPLGPGCNPAWAAAVAALRERVVTPLLGERDRLTAAEWAEVKARFQPRRDWQATKPAGAVGALGAARIRAILASGAKEAILDLIARDLALQAEAEAIDKVERLLRYCRDLAPLLNNFLAFRDFYTGRQKAVFQAGTLYLDGRSCDLCIKVDDPAKHAPVATLSRIYLAYCECVRLGDRGPEKMFIAAAVTAGDSDQLMVGRNGVFYDRLGRDWDASVVRIIDHPISIRQSFWSPYKKLGRMIGQSIEKAATAKSGASQTQMMTLMPGAGTPAKAPPAAAAAPAPAAAAPPFDAGRFAGIFAALGLAVGAIGTAIASVVTGFLALPWWQIPLAILGVLLMVSGPSVVIAALKLHQRNLGPILDANGWAVNTRARINIPFGGALTHLSRLPEGAVRALKDPYAQKSPPWRSALVLIVLAALAAAAWKMGLLDRLATVLK